MGLMCFFIFLGFFFPTVTLNSLHGKQLAQPFVIDDRCDTCSNCSRQSDLHSDTCHRCSASQIETGSICDCSEIQHGTYDSGCYQYYRRHSKSITSSPHLKIDHTAVERSSCKKNLTPSSSLPSVCNEYSDCKQTHSIIRPKLMNHNNERSAAYNHNDHTILPTSSTMKSLAATSQITSKSPHSNDKRRSRYCCGCRAHSRLTVFFIFFVFVLGFIAAFICWPRIPRVMMGGSLNTLNGPPDWRTGEDLPSDASISSLPSLRATWQINVTLDNRDNWIPIYLTRLDFVLVDSLTLVKFAWASTHSGITLDPGRISPLSLTFNVNYQAPDRTDPTFQNLYNACGPLADPAKKRPALNVLLRVKKKKEKVCYSFCWEKKD